MRNSFEINAILHDIGPSNEIPNQEAKCKWSTCTATFKRADELIPHISTLHLSANRFITKKKSLESPTVVTQNSVSDTPSLSGEASPDSATSFETACKWALCSINVDSVDDLVKHLFKEHLSGAENPNLLPHKCSWEEQDECNSRFESFDDLTFHISSIHIGFGKKEYYCRWRECFRRDQVFKTRQNIMRHVQTHTGDKPYQCSICNQRFSETGLMITHLRTHNGQKPFVCPESNCGKPFAVPSALKIHIRKHTGERPYQCKAEGCQKKFADSSNLTKHIRTHTGDKPFKCPSLRCDKTFSRPDLAKRHSKVHEKNLIK